MSNFGRDLRKVLVEEKFVKEPLLAYDYDIIEYDPTEMIGGVFKNYMSVKERVELPRVLWEYYEWVKKHKTYNIDLAIMSNDRIRGDVSFTDMIEKVIITEFLINESMGFPHPPGILAVDPDTEEPLEKEPELSN